MAYYQATSSGAERAPLVYAPIQHGDEGDNSVHVAFDRKGGYNYLCLLPTLIAPFCGPLFALASRKHMESQRCEVTDRHVVFESGWLNHSHKSIPLDRIQDVNVRQDCIQSCFGIKSLEIQTAGAGGGIEPEATLIAPVDAMMVRDAIMDRRDAIVLGHSRGGQDKSERQQTTVSNAVVVEELRSIKESLARLEAHVKAGVDHIVEKKA